MRTDYSIKKAAIVNASGKYLTIILQIVINAILSRLLTPDDYGVVAIITVFSTFFVSLSDMGFGAAVIQRKDLSKEDTDKIFSFSIAIGVALSLIFGVLSFGIAAFYDNNDYIILGWILSISLLFNTINMVPNGIMNREKKFVRIAIRTVCAYIIAAVIAVILAFNGLKYFSIAIQNVISAFVVFAWNYIETKPGLRFNNCFASVRKVLNYSGFQFAFNMVNYLSRNLDNLLTGKFIGNAELGYYYKSYNLMLYPINNLTGVISPVLHPMLSDYQNAKEIIYKKYLNIVKILFVAGCFIAPFCKLASSEIINILYGSQWSESIKCFEILSFAILPQLVGASAGSIYQSLGKTKLLFINGVINTLITVVAILYGVIVGGNIIFLSTCVSIAYIIHFLTVYYILIHYGFRYSIMNFIKSILIDVAIFAIMMISVYVYPFSCENMIISILYKAIYLGFVYGFMLMITKEYRIIAMIFRK